MSNQHIMPLMKNTNQFITKKIHLNITLKKEEDNSMNSTRRRTLFSSIKQQTGELVYIENTGGGT